ncbi:MAG: nuclear transport factor 2 family protein [Pseudomonadota bacterium]
MASIEEKIEATIQGYFDAFNALDANAVVVLFADNATVEDPVGTPLKSGSDEIISFYERSMQSKAKLQRTGPARINNQEAAFPFRAQVTMPQGRLEIDVIDHMTFDEDGKILTMRAFFGEANTRMLKEGEEA